MLRRWFVLVGALLALSSIGVRDARVRAQSHYEGAYKWPLRYSFSRSDAGKYAVTLAPANDVASDGEDIKQIMARFGATPIGKPGVMSRQGVATRFYGQWFIKPEQAEEVIAELLKYPSVKEYGTDARAKIDHQSAAMNERVEALRGELETLAGSGATMPALARIAEEELCFIEKALRTSSRTSGKYKIEIKMNADGGG